MRHKRNKLKEPMPHLEYWLQTRIAERGNNRTIAEYRNEVELFGGFMGSVDAVTFATRKQVREYLFFISVELGLSAATQSRTLAALKSFYTFLLAEDIITKNPCIGIPKPHLPYRLPNVMTRDEIEKAHNVERSATREGEFGDLLRVRNKAMLDVLYSCGLRRSEIVSLQIRDINFTDRSLTVIGKGNKERRVFFNDDCKESIRAWLAIRPHTNAGNLFVTSVGSAISVRQVWAIVKQELEAANIQGSPHTYRHSYATHLHEQGMDIFTLQELLGHASPNTTQRYVHISDMRKRINYDKTGLSTKKPNV